MAKTKKKGARKSQKGIPKRDSWIKVIKPHLEEVLEFYENGATKAQLAEYLGIGRSTFAEMEEKHPEFTEALVRARMRTCNEVRGKMYQLAVGYKKTRMSKRAMPVYDTKGNKLKDAAGNDIIREVSFMEQIEVEPNVSAQLAFLKNCGGWSDNPVVDNALAKNAELEMATRQRMMESLGMRDLSKPRSTEQDVQNRDADVVSDADLDAMGA